MLSHASSLSFADIRQCVSSRRIESYRQPQNSDVEVLARYIWNICLCEALYPSLQNLEITLRNSIYSVGKRQFNNANWLQDNSVVVGTKQRNAIEKIVQDLHKHRKPVDCNHIVAATTFGVWTGFLERNYEPSLWPKGLKEAFPHVPARRRNRRDLYQHFSEIRRLRNRGFHHEPIWNRSTLSNDHAKIIEAIGWINPAMQQATLLIDRFSAVHTSAYFATLKASIG